jgi:5-methylcytosine-specific restriction endonuclease McrA
MFRIEIVGENGEIRGGSGHQRNMPQYGEWRKAVYTRDDYTCQECGAKGNIVAHHVKPWAHYPELRFEVSNGITLCDDCHATKHPHMRFGKRGQTG